MLYALGGMIKEYMGGGRTGGCSGDAKCRGYAEGGKMDGEERGYARGESGMKYVGGGRYEGASVDDGSTGRGDNGMRVMKETDPKKSRKYSAYDTGGSSEEFPKIDIEQRDVQVGRDQVSGEPIFKTSTQFFLDGKPVSSQQAAKSYKMSQEGVQGGGSFNDFVQSYMEQYFDERMGPKHKMPQTRSRVESKETFEESEGIKGLMEVLSQYKLKGEL